MTFPHRNVCKFADVYYALKHMINHGTNMVFSDAEINKSLSLETFLGLLKEFNNSICITIVSNNEKYGADTIKYGADYATTYDGLGELLDKIAKSFGASDSK